MACMVACFFKEHYLHSIALIAFEICKNVSKPLEVGGIRDKLLEGVYESEHCVCSFYARKIQFWDTD